MKINLNHELLFVGDFPYGKTQNIEVKLGRKNYMVDIDRNSNSAMIDFYHKKGEDRNSYSKYGTDSTLAIKVDSKALLDRDFFEHIEEIGAAQRIYDRFSALRR